MASLGLLSAQEEGGGGEGGGVLGGRGLNPGGRDLLLLRKPRHDDLRPLHIGAGASQRPSDRGEYFDEKNVENRRFEQKIVG